jgi:hypothetical protein
MENFFVIYRNPGHWDILDGSHKRIYKIRGCPGAYVVRDTTDPDLDDITCKTVGACMSHICDILMFED